MCVAFRNSCSQRTVFGGATNCKGIKSKKPANIRLIYMFGFFGTQLPLQVLQWFETSLHAWLSALAISKRMDAASVATSERLRSDWKSLRLYTRNWADLTGSKRDALELLGWVISSCLTLVSHLRTRAAGG